MGGEREDPSIHIAFKITVTFTLFNPFNPYRLLNSFLSVYLILFNLTIIVKFSY